MKRRVPGLSDTARDSQSEVPDGTFLVRLDSARRHWHAQKPFYVLRLSILEPAGRPLVSRLYRTSKVMWNLVPISSSLCRIWQNFQGAAADNAGMM